MAVELDMPVAHLVDRDLSDGRAVDERRRRNENLAAEIDGNRMSGRQKKILRRAVGAECVDGDPDQMDRGRAGMGPAVDVAMTDPTGRASPEEVRTRSPTCRSSTTTSPSGLRISVPATKLVTGMTALGPQRISPARN